MKRIRIISIILAAVMAVSALTACSGNQTSGNNKNTGKDFVAFDYSKGIDDRGYIEGLNALDYVELPDYKNIEFPESVLTVTEEQMEYQMLLLAFDNNCYQEIKDRKVENGDIININMKSYCEGEPLDFGNETNYCIKVGESYCVDDSFVKLIGHEPGEEVISEFFFPQNFNTEELRGKKGKIEMTINFIYNYGVTEDDAEKCGFESLDELKETLRKQMIEQMKANYITYDYYLTFQCDEIPESLIKYVEEFDVGYVQASAQSSNSDLTTYLATMGFKNIEGYKESKAQDYRDRALVYLGIQAIAEKEGLTVDDAYLKDVMQCADSDYATYGANYLKARALREAIIPVKLIEYNGITL